MGKSLTIENFRT